MLVLFLSVGGLYYVLQDENLTLTSSVGEMIQADSTSLIAGRTAEKPRPEIDAPPLEPTEADVADAERAQVPDPAAKFESVADVRKNDISVDKIVYGGNYMGEETAEEKLDLPDAVELEKDFDAAPENRKKSVAVGAEKKFKQSEVFFIGSSEGAAADATTVAGAASGHVADDSVPESIADEMQAEKIVAKSARRNEAPGESVSEIGDAAALQQVADTAAARGAFEKYVSENLKPLYDNQGEVLKGEVTAEFEINRRGKPVNIEVTRSLAPQADAEVIRLIRRGPSWPRIEGRVRVVINFGTE